MRFSILTLLGLVAFAANAAEPRERIGHVLGQPVYRDQLATNDFEGVSALFIEPVAKEYWKIHEKEVTVTEDEFQRYKAFKRQELETRATQVRALLSSPELPGEEHRKHTNELSRIERSLDKKREPILDEMWRLQLDGWKLARYFYLQYGGKVIWQQIALYEAVGATKTWYIVQERLGKIKIEDAELSKLFWNEVHRRDGGSLPKELFQEFLNPPWLDAAEAADDVKRGDR